MPSCRGCGADQRRSGKTHHAVGADKLRQPVGDPCAPRRASRTAEGPVRPHRSGHRSGRADRPAGRVVVALTFPDEAPTNRRYWLLVEHGDAEVCYSDPGGEPDLTVERGRWRSSTGIAVHGPGPTCCAPAMSPWRDRHGCGAHSRRGTSTTPRPLRHVVDSWMLTRWHIRCRGSGHPGCEEVAAGGVDTLLRRRRGRCTR